MAISWKAEADSTAIFVLTTQESPMYFRKKTSGGRAYLQIVERPGCGL
jgi:hypothetical protein